jgi:hypothetical protein
MNHPKEGISIDPVPGWHCFSFSFSFSFVLVPQAASQDAWWSFMQCSAAASVHSKPNLTGDSAKNKIKRKRKELI